MISANRKKVYLAVSRDLERNQKLTNCFVIDSIAGQMNAMRGGPVKKKKVPKDDDSSEDEESDTDGEQAAEESETDTDTDTDEE